MEQGNLDNITQGVYNAVANATNAEDQSQANLNLIEESYRRLSVNCNASSSKVHYLFNCICLHVRIVYLQCSLDPEQVSNLIDGLESLQNWRPEIRATQSAEYVNYNEHCSC